MVVKPIEIKPIAPNKFEILAGLTRRPAARFISTELEHYSDAKEHFLGVILIDHTDQDYLAIVLARDEFGKFCCIDIKTSMQSIDDARQWLDGTMRWNSGTGTVIHPQGHNSCPTLNLFEAVVPKERQHVYFQRLIAHAAFRGARKTINEMMPHFVDVDGTFVQQFQTRGFDARLWELYLFAMLKESGFDLDRSFATPDFVGSRFGDEIALEAVIVGRKPGYNISLVEVMPKPLNLAEIETQLKHEMPIKFGSPLFTKLKKKYWQYNHVKGKPFVIAIADFHDDQSMIWSHPSLCAYLYGKRYEMATDADGHSHQVCIDLESHSYGDKTIPSGFFYQPEVENVSAVISSASGTISKFNRMGRQAGYGDPDIRMIRTGYCYNHDPKALEPDVFSYEVNEESREIWSEGINVYHNPNARIPLEPRMFPFAGHHTFIDGNIVSMLPEFHPYSSLTFSIVPKGKDNNPDGLIVP